MDFCTLVIGVFVGIQVANWNGARVEGARAQAYFAHIPDNLKPTCNRSSVTKFSGDRSATTATPRLEPRHARVEHQLSRSNSGHCTLPTVVSAPSTTNTARSRPRFLAS